jgi:hypothetical protein
MLASGAFKMGLYVGCMSILYIYRSGYTFLRNSMSSGGISKFYVQILLFLNISSQFTVPLVSVFEASDHSPSPSLA